MVACVVQLSILGTFRELLLGWKTVLIALGFALRGIFENCAELHI